MSLPTSEPLPPAGDSGPHATPRRKIRRLVIPGDASGQSSLLRELAHRMSPSFDFYLFTLLAGLSLVTALLFDSPALYVLTALLSPFMAPVAGMAFATILSSGRYFGRMFGAAGSGALIMLGWGALAGWLARLWPGLTFGQAYQHAGITWPDLIVLLLGAGMTTYALVRAPGQRPLVTSVAMAYEIYLPAGIAGFGLTSGQPGLWPQALLVFLMNLSLATLMGALVLVFTGLKPLTMKGHFLGAGMTAVALAALLMVNGSGMGLPLPKIGAPPVRESTPPVLATLPNTAQATTPSPADTPRPALTPTATLTVTATAGPSRTATNTLVPSRTPTITDTVAPTPAWAFIAASSGGGVLVRAEPGFDKKLVKTLINGLMVEILPEVVQADGVTWVKIRTPRGDVEGWVVRSLLTNATPAPGW